MCRPLPSCISNTNERPSTFSEFLDFLEKWENEEWVLVDDYIPFESDNLESELIKMLIKRFILTQNTTNGPINFNNQLFKSLLEDIKLTVSNYHSINDQGSSQALINNDSQVLLRPVLALRLDDSVPPFIQGTLDVYIVNPNSPNKDLALSYVEKCMQSVSDIDRIILFDEEHSPIQSEFYRERINESEEEIARLQNLLKNNDDENSAYIKNQISDIEKQLAFYRLNQYTVTDEMIEEYTDMVLPYLVFPAPSPFDPDSNITIIDSILGQYLEQQIGIEQFIRKLNEKSQMIWIEDQ